MVSDPRKVWRDSKVRWRIQHPTEGAAGLRLRRSECGKWWGGQANLRPPGMTILLRMISLLQMILARGRYRLRRPAAEDLTYAHASPSVLCLGCVCRGH